MVAKTTHPPDDEPDVILIVEDEPSVAMLEAEVLKRSGFVVEQVSLGNRALEVVESRRIAVIVADYTMPDMTGAGFVAALRERAEIPVIGVTGHSDPAVERQMRDAGVFEFLVKDASLDFLDRLPGVVAQAIVSSRPASHQTEDQA